MATTENHMEKQGSNPALVANNSNQESHSSSINQLFCCVNNGFQGVRPQLRQIPEVVQLLYVLMFSMCVVPRDKIYIDKVCQVDLRDWLAEQNLTASICAHINNDSAYKHIEEKTQEIVSELKFYEGLIINIPSIVFAIFSGAWADRRGRRFLLILPFVGNILSFLAALANLYWWNELSSAWLLTSGISGLTGGYICLNIGLYSYIADTTTQVNRTCRMSILNGVFSLGYIAGIQIGSRLQNYYTVFITAIALGVISLLYTVLVLEESLQRNNSMVQQLTDPTDKLAGSQQQPVDISFGGRQPSGCFNPRSTFFFDLCSVVDCLKTTFRRRDGGARPLILLGLIQFQVFMLCLNTTDFDYLMTRLRFSWAKEDFGNYLTVQRVCRLVGLWLVLPSLSRIVGIRDGFVSAIGCGVSCLAYLILALATPEWTPGGGSLVDWPIYLSAVLQLNSVTTVAIRSRLSKLVDKDEVGKMFAVVGILQAIISLVGYSLFSLIYHHSLTVLPSAYLLPVIAMLGLATLSSFVIDPHVPCSIAACRTSRSMI